ncbi:MAG: type II toxin-antitoxin system HicB family antitoxin [Betaproteobacteria bacterium]
MSNILGISRGKYIWGKHLAAGLIQIQFKLPANIKKKGKLFISWCPLLDVYSQGKTKKEALVNLNEAVRLFIESCLQRGTLEQVLRDSGFEQAEKQAATRDDKRQYVNVPVSLIARKHAEARAH